MDPFDYPRSAYLDPATYERRIAGRQYLIYVARPFREQIYPSLDPGRYLVLLYDEEKTIERVGGKKLIRIDVRILAATNRDRAAEIQRGRFREDLFYCMNVFRIQLPPLRDRKEDIADLVAFFVQQFSAPFNKTVEKISPGYLASLINYPWPGNVREWRNAVEYSIAILDGKILLEEHLSGFLPQPSARSVPMTTEVEMEGVSFKPANKTGGLTMHQIQPKFLS